LPLNVHRSRNDEKIAKPSFIYNSWGRLRRHRLALSGFGVFIVIIIMAIFSPLLSPYDPALQFWGQERKPPSSRFLLGTDTLGRDLFSRIIWGARSSLYVGGVATTLMVFIGIAVGAFSGYYGGIIDNLLMRITDIFLAIPAIFLVIAIASVLEQRSLTIIAFTIAAISWPRMARIVRSSFLSLKQSTYVEAARSVGASDLRIVFIHILPNAMAPIIITATLNIASSILVEAALGFLGLGDPTALSWGNLLNEGRSVLTTAWWIATFPGIAIFFTVLGFNLLGDGLRDALDVRLEPGGG